MKKIIKGISLFVVIALSLVFAYPLNTYALTEQTSYVSIDNTQNLEVGSLSFSSISFRDYSSTSTQAFGLTGVVANSSSDTISYTSTAYYYDSNYNLIAQGYNSGTAISGTSNFNQMSNLSILGEHSINEIYYYRLSINISGTTNSSGTINSSSLTPSKNYQYSSYDYVIDKYDINIIVNENNTFDITETITAYFNVSKHGIFRTIPLKNTITRLDGTTSTNRTQVTNVSVDNEYTTSRKNGNYKLQIGSANSTLTGEQKYVIKYTYNLGKDPAKNYDELYYNIIGNEWDTVIGNITFSITMPKDFDSSKLGFSSGNIGSTDNSKVKYNVSGNKITGSYNGVLSVGQALTVRCELPEGYFVGAGLNINIMDYIMFLIPVIFLVIAILLWYKFGRDDQVVETVEFYPPQGFNSLEVGFLYKGQADNQDVTSLLIYLANQGYIKIVETEEKSLFSKSKGFKITKLKEYDGNNKNEKCFLDELFLDYITSHSDDGLYTLKKVIEDVKKINNVPINNVKEEKCNCVNSEALRNTFYITINKILGNINSKSEKLKIFENANKGVAITICMILLTLLSVIVVPFFKCQSPEGKDALIVIMSLIIFVALPYVVMFLTDHYKLALNLLFMVFVVFAFDPFYRSIKNIFLVDNLFPFGLLIGTISIVIMIICLKNMTKRTKYGNQMLGRIRGFKNFLETAEKEKLNAMIMQNPNYFYDILPYTYVLGISDKWIKKFESISLQPPTWYDSPNTFDIVDFGSSISSTMSSAERAMSSSPSSDSNSFDSSPSGDGFSGGGSGGGGGSSW